MVIRFYLPMFSDTLPMQVYISHFNHVQLFVTLWYYRPPGSSVHGILPESWSGLQCPSPRDLPDPGIEPLAPETPAFQVDSLPLSTWGKPYIDVCMCVCVCVCVCVKKIIIYIYIYIAISITLFYQ